MESFVEIAPFWAFAGIMLCLVAMRPSRVKHDKNKGDLLAALLAIVFMLVFWPVWAIVMFWRGWRFRHPRVIKLS